MISKHDIGWIVKDPLELEEVSFSYPPEVREGQRVQITSTLRNNTSEPKRAKLTVSNKDTGQELLSNEGEVGPFATVDISVAGIARARIALEAVVEEVTV